MSLDQPSPACVAHGHHVKTVSCRRGTLRVSTPAVTDPPGELTYMVTSSFPTESRYSSCATIRLAMSSSTGPPMRTIRCAPQTHGVLVTLRTAYTRLVLTDVEGSQRSVPEQVLCTTSWASALQKGTNQDSLFRHCKVPGSTVRGVVPALL